MSVSAAGLHVIPGQEEGDASLIARALGGEASAYEGIVARYQRRIYRVAWAILKDESEADTVTQDTFVQAYLHLGRFEGRAGLETWLTRIAINKARDLLRARRGRRWIGLGSPDPDGAPVPEPADERPDAERESISRELSQAIDRSMDGLSAQQRVVFRMRHYEERSLEEIATLLGLKAGTVRAHLFRAVQKLRKDLSAWGIPARKEMT